MEDTYYFSQGRLAYSGTYNINQKSDDIETGMVNKIGYSAKNANENAGGAGGAAGAAGAANGLLSKIWNFQLYNKSILRYRL